MSIVSQLYVIEQGALEVLRLVRSWKNGMAPINRIPPEILSLVPDFLDMYHRDQATITLTHVCQAWREVFVSRPSLWTNIDCVDSEQTRVYLERSKSSPINLSLNSDSFHDLELIPSATGRLKYLDINADPEDLEFISSYLSHPAPLLEELSIRSGVGAVLPSSLLNGDISSLYKLRLIHVHTELPWRNVANLTSFMFAYTSPPVSLSQFLDFFENAPHLREVDVLSSTPIPGARNGRLVPLASLQRMNASSHSSSHLFDHLLIPVGARLTMGVDLPSPQIDGRPPRFMDNLKNLSDFTAIQLGDRSAGMKFSGPNGEVHMVPRVNRTCSMLEFLTHLDTSKTEQLEIMCDKSAVRDSLYQALRLMKDLRILTLAQCDNPHTVIHALDPSMNSSGVVVCPKLREVMIECYGTFDIKDVVETVMARGLRGVKLEAVRILSWTEPVISQQDIRELKKHVTHVECVY